VKKCWDHVTVASRELTLVANFSVLDDRCGLATLVFAADVAGHVRTYAAEDCRRSSWRTALRFEASSLCERDGRLALVLDVPELALAAELVLRPATSGSQLHNLGVGGGGALHWSVWPRLRATGNVHYRGATYRFADAPAYRDRNWGAFEFGRVAWDWGYLLPDDDASPFALVFTRLLDPTRTTVFGQHVLVWEGRELLGSYRDREVEFSPAGCVHGPVTSLPPALALIRPGRAHDVPAQLAISAASRRGAIALEIACAHTARVLVPRDTGRGATAIHESLGRGRARGELDGCAIDVAGHTFLEVVHA